MLPISSYENDSRYRYCQSLRSWYVPRAESSWYRSSYPYSCVVGSTSTEPGIDWSYGTSFRTRSRLPATS
ncbi:hypothetical protein WME97_36860 [Sorangium sp. So ce367]|uniref:hypothetical protein n=1 Tax=Sorangium sp. So ce367 TaxID=3133305 RepID=UPI003F5E530B